MGQVESGGSSQRRLPAAPAARLPQYLCVLSGLAERGITKVTSAELAERLGLTSANVRKDLSVLNLSGVRGAPYDVAQLLGGLRQVAGFDEVTAVVVVGSGELAGSVLDDPALADPNYHVLAVSSPEEARDDVAQTRDRAGVRPYTQIDEILREVILAVAIVATPAALAQGVVDRLGALGVRNILNLSPARVVAPNGVLLRQRDLAGEMAEMVYQAQREAAAFVNGTGTIDLRERRLGAAGRHEVSKSDDSDGDLNEASGGGQVGVADRGSQTAVNQDGDLR